MSDRYASVFVIQIFWSKKIPMEDFHKVSTRTLEGLADFFESSWPDADIDLLDDVLTVSLPKGHQYVINKHGVTRQIWVASPYSGAHHFHLKEGEWRCTRTNERLEDLLLTERNDHAA